MDIADRFGLVNDISFADPPARARTTCIWLYGGPGTGKSTTAADLFARFKQRGVNAELVQECAKEWAWQGRKIEPIDQFHLLREQIERERRLYGKVRVLVTDSPFTLGCVYARRYSAPVLADAVDALASAALVNAQNGVEHIQVMLRRTKPYQPAGRFETEEQAREIDGEMHALAAKFGPVHTWSTEDVPGLFAKLCAELGV